MMYKYKLNSAGLYRLCRTKCKMKFDKDRCRNASFQKIFHD